ncbi:MAG: hypothetical protein QW289_05240 [Sulfolobales archaeon]
MKEVLPTETSYVAPESLLDEVVKCILCDEHSTAFAYYESEKPCSHLGEASEKIAR